MTLTRRAFTHGTASLAAATALPPSARAETAPFVRRSINDLVDQRHPLVESYRRGVEVMMKRDITDKTSWWFQANVHDLPDSERGQLPSLAKYWKQCPHKNYFFLSWHRIYLYFFERIIRKASGDPSFALPYWNYADPRHASVPTCFLPEDEEFGDPPQKDPTPPPDRRNPLARTKRHAYVDHRWVGLGDVVRDVNATMALDHFTATDKLDALKAFGGVRTDDHLKHETAGGVESCPHNLVHRVIGIDGDMGGTETAARDPLFWLHHANVDRMWARWTDPARGRIAPVVDEAWMKRRFTFIDENGEDRVMTPADVLDTQFQLGYRYDDDPPRAQRLEMRPPATALRLPSSAVAPAGSRRAAPEPVIVARIGAMRLEARETQLVLVLAPALRPRGAQPPRTAASPKSGRNAAGPQRLRVVLRDVVARDAGPSYDVYLVLEGASVFEPSTSSVRVGGLDLFGGAGGGGHHGAHAGGGGGETIAFDATDAVAQLSRTRGFEMRRLRVSIVRRGFQLTIGGEFVPPDADPPRIGAIELLQS